MNRTKACLLALAGVFLQLGLAGPAVAVDGVHSVEQLLRKLSLTLQEQNYRGLFTYEYGGTLDTLEVVHVVEEGVEYERLQHLSGPSREVVRQGRSTSCINTAAQLLRGGFVTASNTSQPLLSEYYDLSLAGSERVANRNVTVVRLIPKDPYRYGLTLSVDRATGFPMKTLILSESQRVLERLQFVELDFSPAADGLPVKPERAGYVALPSNPEACANKGEGNADQRAEKPATHWEASWLPPGFVLSWQSFSTRNGHQLTYTDGLASFSIFVSPTAALGQIQPTVAQRGATLALMLPLKDRAESVTVVGEIPPVTAEKVALGLRIVSGGAE